MRHRTDLDLCQARRDEGSATVETAVTLPVLVIVLAMGLWGLAAVVAQLRCTDAAGVAARAAARGDAAPAVAAAGRTAAPDGAAVRVDRGPELVTVVVTTQVRAPGPVAHLLPALDVQGRAVATREDSP